MILNCWYPSPLYNPPAIATGLAFCFSICLENAPVHSEARLNKPVDGVHEDEDQDAYWMLSKIQKEAYEKFTEFIAVAEVFVEMKAEQAKKRIKKSAMAK